MRERIMFFTIGLLFALVSLFILEKFEFTVPGTVTAQKTYDVEVIYKVARESSFEKEVAIKLSEGFRVIGFSSHYIPRADPGLLVLMVK